MLLSVTDLKLTFVYSLNRRIYRACAFQVDLLSWMTSILAEWDVAAECKDVISSRNSLRQACVSTSSTIYALRDVDGRMINGVASKPGPKVSLTARKAVKLRRMWEPYGRSEGIRLGGTMNFGSRETRLVATKCLFEWLIAVSMLSVFLTNKDVYTM